MITNVNLKKHFGVRATVIYFAYVETVFKGAASYKINLNADAAITDVCIDSTSSPLFLKISYLTSGIGLVLREVIVTSPSERISLGRFKEFLGNVYGPNGTFGVFLL
jgi:hypothetical protein